MAVGDTFKNRAGKEFHRTGSCRNIYDKTLAILLLFGGPFFILTLVYAPDLFAVLLGEQWRESGRMSRLIAPMLIARFVSNPLRSIYLLRSAQRELLLASIATAGCVIVVVLLIAALSRDPGFIIMGLSGTYTFAYVLIILRGRSYTCATTT
jgi:O-antigen/teichoic acid export membrane protein